MKKQKNVLVNWSADAQQLETRCLGLWQLPKGEKDDAEVAVRRAWKNHMKTDRMKSFESFLTANGWVQIERTFAIADVRWPEVQTVYNQQHLGD